MRLVNLTMPAALLLSLCVSCNSHSSEAKQNYLGRRIKSASSEQAKDKEANPVLSSSAADSAAAGNTIGYGQAQTEDEKYERQTGGGAGPSKQHAEKKPSDAPQANPDWDKKIVKTADLKLEVKSFQSYTDQIHRLVKQSGGYIAQEQQNQSVYTIENTVTIKVPVDRFDDMMMHIASDSDKLVEKKISAEDVTMQIVDTKSRLEAKREVRERYLDLLKQARNMKDILAVQTEINDIQEEMEEAAGRIAYLGHSAAYSTINLNFYQVLTVVEPEDASPSFFHKLQNALTTGWEGFSSLVLGLISLWPLWMVVSLGLMGIRKWRAGLPVKPAASRP